MRKMIKSSLFILFWSFVVISCASQLTTLSNGKKIDNRLTGIWTGSEKDEQIEGVEKKWNMTRNHDGTFLLDFEYTQDGLTQNTQESGSWWVEGDKFYEYHEDSGKTDVYSYTVLNKDQIKFKSESISVGMNNDDYEFVDTRSK